MGIGKELLWTNVFEVEGNKSLNYGSISKYTKKKLLFQVPRKFPLHHEMTHEIPPKSKNKYTYLTQTFTIEDPASSFTVSTTIFSFIHSSSVFISLPFCRDCFWTIPVKKFHLIAKSSVRFFIGGCFRRV